MAQIRRIGKKTKKWIKFRKEFLKGKAGHEGYYICEICSLWTKTPEIDHIHKRSVAPDKVFDTTNLRILCHNCHINVNDDYKGEE